MALALPLWLLVGEPAVLEGEALARSIGLAYPVADLVLLVLVVEGLLGRGRAGPGPLLLGAGVLGVVASDVAFAVLTTSGSYVSGGPADLGWLVQRVLLALLILSPVLAGGRLAIRADPPVAVVRDGARHLFLGVLAATAPLSLLLRSEVGPRQVVLVCLVTLAITVLVLLRLSLVSRALRQALATQSEQVVRAEAVAAAGVLLLGAVDGAAAGRAALDAVLRLVVPPGGHGAAALGLGPAALLHPVAADARGLTAEEAGAVDLSLLSNEDRARLDRGEEVERRIRSTTGADEDVVLVLPLRLPSRFVGVLVVAAPLDRVDAARTGLRAVVPLAALALDKARSHDQVAAGRDPGVAPARAPQDALSGGGIVAEIARGLRDRQFVVHYQPIVDLEDGLPRGFEALVRWQHPVRGLLMPGSFLAEVEACGLLAQLDAEVMGQACRQAVRFDRRHDGPYVSVNASAAQLLDPRFPSLVRAALTGSGLAPWRLLIELTETAAVSDPVAVAAVLERVRQQRVRVAFDDFGTGYSSLSWLQQLPLDVVKIDKSFVDRLPTQAGERPVVEALVALAHTLGLTVRAEGVERPDQRRALQSMGVRAGQGWLFSKALPAEQAAALLTRRPPLHAVPRVLRLTS